MNGFLNAGKLLLQKTLLKSISLQVENTPEMSTSALSCYFCMNIRQIEHGNISLSQIINLTTVF